MPALKYLSDDPSERRREANKNYRLRHPDRIKQTNKKHKSTEEYKRRKRMLRSGLTPELFEIHELNKKIKRKVRELRKSEKKSI